jgi:hypothetical protein
MQTRLKLKKLLQKYGDKLVCVRYRYDTAEEKRYKTVELIEEEVIWKPKVQYKRIVVSIRIDWGEDLWKAVKSAGGKWNSKKRVWELKYQKALELGLKDRIVD